jgi:hypothetical protein
MSITSSTSEGNVDVTDGPAGPDGLPGPAAAPTAAAAAAAATTAKKKQAVKRKQVRQLVGRFYYFTRIVTSLIRTIVMVVVVSNVIGCYAQADTTTPLPAGAGADDAERRESGR